MVPDATHQQQVIMSEFMCEAAGQAHFDATARDWHRLPFCRVLQITLESFRTLVDMLHGRRSVHFGSQTAVQRCARAALELSKNWILHAGY